MDIHSEVVKIGDVEIRFETGRLAKQANSVVVSAGETAALVTAVSSREPKDLPFLPLTVEYREANAAAGKIPGGYFRREGRPMEKEILTSRLIDRPIRPLFPKSYRNDSQVIVTLLSHDLENDSDVLCITGASTALMISEVPWAGPIAGIRVARIDGKLVAFPPISQMDNADLNLVVACSEDAIVMVEAGAQELSESDMIDALMFAKDQAQPLLAAQHRMREKAGKEKRVHVEPTIDEALKAKVYELARGAVTEALEIRSKHDRADAIKNNGRAAVASLMEQHPEQVDEIKDHLSSLARDIVRDKTVSKKIRIDGRKLDEIRPLHIEVHPYERPHGSALFQRGETQAYATCTLGTLRDGQRLDTIHGDIDKHFLLHYNFPPFCTGEAKPLRGSSRREIGHGALAHRALSAVMPETSDFPYAVRVVSDTLESNGSSSMAAVCGGCLALMDAGVPIKSPVAGIAMGLIQEGKKIAVLSDILGDEDHLGDMDFKVTGSANGITALQMDIKVEGLTRDILEGALEQARKGRLHILEAMKGKLAEPRTELSPHAPRIETIQVRIDKIRDIIGSGGKTIRGITEQTGVAINIDDAGVVQLASSSKAAIEAAKAIIEGITFEPEPGSYYQGVVRRIERYGAFIEIAPGTDGLCHVSELENRRVENVTDILSEGDEVIVKVLAVDDSGKIRLSRKAAFGVDPDEVQNIRI